MTLLSDHPVSSRKTAPSAAELEACWMPFTANRQFKAKPRLFARAEGMYYWTSDGHKVLDGFAGLWCGNAGHGRKPIVEAIQRQAATMDYSPAFQMGHELAFELANRIVDLAPEPLDHVYWGPSFRDDDIEHQLKSCGLAYRTCDEVAEAAAELLAAGKVIGWFQGRLEGGPRALGGRSILADPRNIAARDRVNAAVKFREYWRPFCPSLTEESASRFLKKAGKVELGDVAIDSGNDFLTVTVTALDDQPLATSKKLLIQAMTEEQPFGFKTSGGATKKIENLGSAPFGVKRINATVTLKLTGYGTPTVTALDENGYAAKKDV